MARDHLPGIDRESQALGRPAAGPIPRAKQAGVHPRWTHRGRLRPLLRPPPSQGQFAHQGQGRPCRDGIHTNLIAGIVPIHHIQTRGDAKVRSEEGQGLVLRTIDTFRVPRTLSASSSFDHGPVGGFAGDGAGSATGGLLRIGQFRVPMFARLRPRIEIMHDLDRRPARSTGGEKGMVIGDASRGRCIVGRGHAG